MVHFHLQNFYHHGDIQKVNVQNSKGNIFHWIELLWYETVTPFVFPYTLHARHASHSGLIIAMMTYNQGTACYCLLHGPF